MTLPGGNAFEHVEAIRLKITKAMMIPASMMVERPITIEDVTDSFMELQFGRMMVRQLAFQPEMIVRVSNFKARSEETIKKVREAATGKVGVHVSNGQTTMHLFLEKGSDAVLIKMWLA